MPVRPTQAQLNRKVDDATGYDSKVPGPTIFYRDSKHPLGCPWRLIA